MWGDQVLRTPKTNKLTFGQAIARTPSSSTPGVYGSSFTYERLDFRSRSKSLGVMVKDEMGVWVNEPPGA